MINPGGSDPAAFKSSDICEYFTHLLYSVRVKSGSLTLWIMDQVDGGEIKNFHFFLLFMFLRKPNEICTLSIGINDGHYSAFI